MAATTPRWIWPTITDVASARYASKSGMWAAISCSGIALAWFAAAKARWDVPRIGLAALISAGLFALVAWGLHRASRMIAVAGLLLYLTEIVHLMITTHSTGGRTPIFLGLFFINGIRGTFAFHQMGGAAPLAAPAEPGRPSATVERWRQSRTGSRPPS